MLQSILKSVYAIFCIWMTLTGCNTVSSVKEDDPVNDTLGVNITSLNISGKAQSLSFEITGNQYWTISSNDWIEISSHEGNGSETITVTVGENLYESRQGSIRIVSKNKTHSIKVVQDPVFMVTKKRSLVRSFYGYKDTYKLYAESIDVNLSHGIDDVIYHKMIPAIENEYNKKEYQIQSLKVNEYYIVPGFSMEVNDKTCFDDMTIRITQSWMEDKDNKSLEYYQKLSREDFLSLLKNAILEHSMLASFPDTPTIPLELAIEGQNKVRFYIADSSGNNIQQRFEYSFLNFDEQDLPPMYGTNEFSILFDRFDSRKFMDNDENTYTINVLSKKLKDIPYIDLELEKIICSYEFNPQATYPVIRITKNNELFYELLATMYVEWLGTSLNNGEECYCTGFSCCNAIDGEAIMIDLESGADDDSKPWFQFSKTRTFDFKNGEFNNYEMQTIELFPIEEGKIPLVGSR